MPNPHDIRGDGHTIHQRLDEPFQIGNGQIKSSVLTLSLYATPQPEPPEGHDDKKPWCECGQAFDNRAEAMDHLRVQAADSPPDSSFT